MTAAGNPDRDLREAISRPSSFLLFREEDGGRCVCTGRIWVLLTDLKTSLTRHLWQAGHCSLFLLSCWCLCGLRPWRWRPGPGTGSARPAGRTGGAGRQPSPSPPRPGAQHCAGKGLGGTSPPAHCGSQSSMRQIRPRGSRRTGEGLQGPSHPSAQRQVLSLPQLSTRGRWGRQPLPTSAAQCRSPGTSWTSLCPGARPYPEQGRCGGWGAR